MGKEGRGGEWRRHRLPGWRARTHARTAKTVGARKRKKKPWTALSGQSTAYSHCIKSGKPETGNRKGGSPVCMNQDEGSLSGRPYASHLRSDDRKVVRKIERDPWNRLRSIAEDSQWVVNVAEALPELPLIGELRKKQYIANDCPVQELISATLWKRICGAVRGTLALSSHRPRGRIPTATSSRQTVMLANGAVSAPCAFATRYDH